jgi:hypothetical protein
MPSPGVLCHVPVVIIDVSEEHIASIIRVTSLGELRTTLATTTNRSTLLVILMIEAMFLRNVSYKSHAL